LGDDFELPITKVPPGRAIIEMVWSVPGIF